MDTIPILLLCMRFTKSHFILIKEGLVFFGFSIILILTSADLQRPTITNPYILMTNLNTPPIS